MSLQHAHGFDLEARLRERERAGLRRHLDPVDAVAGRARTADDPGGDPPEFGEERVVFAANNYLGLAGDERVAGAAARAAREVGAGAGASRLVVGDTPIHRSLERRLAEEKGTERALAFSSGYAANVGTITALDPDVIYSDELNHASIVDGARLSGADVEVYDHCDAADLAATMAARAEAADAGESWLVVTDSVFSMDGDAAPLAAVCDAAEEFGAWVMVDEAHATGVYEGGLVGERGLADRVDVQLGTLSKALGAQGGFVAGDEPLVEHLLNAARSFVFSTGLAPPAAAAAERALELAPERRESLWRNVDRLRDGLETLGYEVWGDTHVLPVVVGDRADALALEGRLSEAGVVAPAIRPPTVPEGTSRIRLAPQATHTDADVDRCLSAFEAAAEEGDFA
ncbi:aminotransferase class I/II-fold pyridoxal phosphate-dependent enzyme [Natronomonas marina]|jgi:8-amino-7-oxononanoate synthase|uniref:aminotransferase class I/II-fold pyridoxal phosphate-dependent enzyme n=1 Tax=Natronomonas marina TaxID=2961939 RepID=UPI0020C962C6|nr:8-amino-7-oxononanoate synthase [Natronomonas marina]